MDANCKYEYNPRCTCLVKHDRVIWWDARWKAKANLQWTIILPWVYIKALVFGKSRYFIGKWVAYLDNLWVLPPVFVRLVLLASVGVSRGLLRESGGSDSMCGCWLWWCGLEKIPFCCTAPPAIIFYKEALGSLSFSLDAIRRYGRF